MLTRSVYSPMHPQEHGGKLAVLGSAHIFSDGYIDKEENSKLQEIIFKWLTTDDVSLNQIDADNPEVGSPSPPLPLYPGDGEVNTPLYPGDGEVDTPLYPGDGEVDTPLYPGDGEVN